MGDRYVISRALITLADGIEYLTDRFDHGGGNRIHYQSVCEIQARVISERLAVAGRPMRTLSLVVLSVLGPYSVHDRTHRSRLQEAFVAQGNPLCDLLDAAPPTPQEAVVWWLVAAFNHVRRDAYRCLPTVSIADWDRMADTMAIADRVDELAARHVPADLAFLVESGLAARGPHQSAATPGSIFEAAAGLVCAPRALVADCVNFILTPDAGPCTSVVAGIRFAALIAGGRHRVFEGRAQLAAAAEFVADSLLNAEPEWCTLQLPPVII